jgi:hypothetical protein
MSLVQQHFTDEGWKRCVAASPATCKAKFNGKPSPHKDIKETLNDSLDKLAANSGKKIADQSQLDAMLNSIVKTTSETAENYTEKGQPVFTIDFQKKLDILTENSVLEQAELFDYNILPPVEAKPEPTPNEWGIIEPVEETIIPLPRTVEGEYKNKLVDIFNNFDGEDTQKALRGRAIINRMLKHINIPSHQVEDFIVKSTKNFELVKNIIQSNVSKVK